MAIRDPRLAMSAMNAGSPLFEEKTIPLETRVFFFYLRSRIYHLLLSSSQFYDSYLLPETDPAAHRVSVQKEQEAEKARGEISWWSILVSPERLFMKMGLPAISSAVVRFAWQQTNIDQAIIACALERYRLEHGEYPETLAALVPRYAARLPNDVITGQPLHYQRTPEGSFLLYAVGWNQKDDGGVEAIGPSGKIDMRKGDWVWRYPFAATP